MSYRAAFAAALRAWRLSKGWSLLRMQQELARREPGRSPSVKSIALWESGEGVPLPKWMPGLLRLGFVPPPRRQPSVLPHTRFKVNVTPPRSNTVASGDLHKTIRRAFDEDRARAIAGAKYQNPDEAPRSVCRYCGQRWHRMPASRHDGHVNCLVSPAFMRFVLEVTETGTLCREVAEILGVTYKTIRAWTVRAMELRDQERALGNCF